LVFITNSQWFMWTILECKTWFVHWWNGGEIWGKVLFHSLIHESKTLLTCNENFTFAICQGFKMHPKLRLEYIVEQVDKLERGSRI
jgi:hypothetical protein